MAVFRQMLGSIRDRVVDLSEIAADAAAEGRLGHPQTGVPLPQTPTRGLSAAHAVTATGGIAGVAGGRAAGAARPPPLRQSASPPRAAAAVAGNSKRSPQKGRPGSASGRSASDNRHGGDRDSLFGGPSLLGHDRDGRVSVGSGTVRSGTGLGRTTRDIGMSVTASGPPSGTGLGQLGGARGHGAALVEGGGGHGVDAFVLPIALPVAAPGMLTPPPPLARGAPAAGTSSTRHVAPYI